MAEVATIGMLFFKGVEAIAGYAEAEQEADAVVKQAEFQKKVYESNKRLAEYSAEDVMSRGERAINDLGTVVQSTIGAQRSSYASQGVDVNTGIAVDVAAETAVSGAVDALTIKNNATREAFGYKIQAINYSRQGKFVEEAAKRSASNTLLTGGLRSLAKLGEGAYKGYTAGFLQSSNDDDEGMRLSPFIARNNKAPGRGR